MLVYEKKDHITIWLLTGQRNRCLFVGSVDNRSLKISKADGFSTWSYLPSFTRQ